MSNYTYGSFTFDKIGPGFVAFRIETHVGDIRSFLNELKLIEIKQKKRWSTWSQWRPDFAQFLAEHGYRSDAEVIKAMRTTGLIMKADRAIAFRLQFL